MLSWRIPLLSINPLMCYDINVTLSLLFGALIKLLMYAGLLSACITCNSFVVTPLIKQFTPVSCCVVANWSDPCAVLPPVSGLKCLADRSCQFTLPLHKGGYMYKYDKKCITSHFWCDVPQLLVKFSWVFCTSYNAVGSLSVTQQNVKH